jgi:outer membrane receptor for ferrienterochelin and colicins
MRSNNKSYILLITLLFLAMQAHSQIIEGTVLSNTEKGKKTPLIGATIRWENSKTGEITDPDGYFKIKKNPENQSLIVSLIGFKSDTIKVNSFEKIEILLSESQTDLDGVIVRGNASVIDRMNPIQTEILTSATLKKAACCNLSESFETNSSVSVGFSDAITGSKQIQMLGLSGTYVQINTENIPNIRGLNTIFGLNYTPGTWVNSIDIAKGVGSVTNGYEAMTGAINVELIKPESSDKVFVNNYLNSQGRAELNVHLSKLISKKWTTGLLTHVSSQIGKVDGNNDSFLDLPLYKQFNFINRWKYSGAKFSTQFGVKYLSEDRVGGQTKFNPTTDKFTSNAYGFGSNTNRIELFTKLALLFPNKPFRGLGLIINGLNHQNDSYIGFKRYTGNERTLYANLLYKDIISNSNHAYTTGASLLIDNYNEFFIDSTFKRNETAPGLFGEYSFTIPNKINVLIGSRVDFHNLFGTKFTPRIHTKFDLTSNTQLRASFGKGWRMPNAIAENFGMFVNTRHIKFLEKIAPEESSNYGISLTNEFRFLGQNGNIIIDYYKTNFKNQLITDLESAHQMVFYNLKGTSFANSFQTEINYNPAERFDVKLAYRLFDVKNSFTTVDGQEQLLSKQFVNKNRILFNTSYATKWNKWKYDFTWQWNGKRRIPNMKPGHVHTVNSEQLFAPAFSNINFQVTKVYKNWEFYLGTENALNFKQENPIFNAIDPFGKGFDASMVWGPVAGRVIYSGLRWKLSEI